MRGLMDWLPLLGPFVHHSAVGPVYCDGRKAHRVATNDQTIVGNNVCIRLAPFTPSAVIREWAQNGVCPIHSGPAR